MKCHYCGEEMNEKSIFCVNCGTRQEPMREEIPSKEAPVAVSEEEYTFKPNLDGLMTYDLPPLPEFQMEAVSRNAQSEQEAEEPKAEAPKTEEPKAGVSRLQLPVHRGLGKMVFLGILTLGIYSMVIWSRIVTELNIAASCHDGERTMPYFAMVMLAPFTLGIYVLVWFHDFSRRIGTELKRRQIQYQFGARDFWLWNILGSLILVGPFVYTHKLMKSMNLINGDFNVRG